MTARPPMRCTHFAADDGPRCTSAATHRLLTSFGDRVPGSAMCKKHAQEVVTEYREKLGWEWAMQPLDPQAARIAELESIADLAMQLTAHYPVGSQMGDIYDACERAGMGQSKEATDD